MALTPTNHKKRKAGFTLAELLVSLAISTVIVLGAVSFYSFSASSFAAMSNYTDMNQRDRRASDLISRDIRASSAVSNATPTQLVLSQTVNGTNADVTYLYDTTARTLTRSRVGTVETVLQGINSLSWTLYTRPVSGTYNDFPTTTVPATAKLVSVQWNCSRSLGKSQTNSQTMQTALIEMRNQ